MKFYTDIHDAMVQAKIERQKSKQLSIFRLTGRGKVSRDSGSASGSGRRGWKTKAQSIAASVITGN